MSIASPTRTLDAPTVPDYRLMHVIGRGTFGEVWLAEETLTGLRRAVKLLFKSQSGGPASPLRELSGVREYQQKSKGHPCLLQIYHVGETADFFYYVMELAEGNGGGGEGETGRPGEGEYQPLTLAALIARDAPMPARRALEITAQILRGLEHLHEEGLLHRDVKPSNVLVVGGQIKLGDLGLVTSQDRDVTFVYTPGYAPSDAKMDHTFDLYATGIILYEMLTGLHRSKFPELPIYPPMVRGEKREFRAAIRIANKAAHPDRRLRYSSATEFLHDVVMRRRSLAWPARLSWALALVGATLAIAVWRFSGDDRKPKLNSVRLPETRKDNPNLIILDYSDGLHLEHRFETAVAGVQAIDFDGNGHTLVVVGFWGPVAGRLLAFDPAVFRGTGRAAPLAEIPYDDLPPSAWSHQTFDKPPCVQPVLAHELDGNPGQELVVCATWVECPTQFIVYTRGWRRLSEYWHYGHMTDVRACDLTADGQPELICSGFANRRDDPDKFGAQYEEIHWAHLVLDPRADGAPVGHWSVNAWMNQRSPRPPISYGHVVMSRRQEAGDWGPHESDSIQVFPGSACPIRCCFQNGWMFELSASLKATELRLGGREYKPLERVLLPAEFWHRLWPPDDVELREPVKDSPGGGE